MFAYQSELLARRLLFGPFPNKGALQKLLGELGVTHIVNIMPATQRLTTKGLPADTWYSCFWEPNKKSKKQELRAPTLLRYPLFSTATKQRDRVAWYTSTAQRIAAELAPTDCVYVHNESGLDEEALLAFVLCEVLQPGSVPSVDEWIAAHPHASGVLLSADARALLQECLEQLAASASDKSGAGQRSVLGWVTVRKRVKVAE